MITGNGIDIVDVKRIEESIRNYGTQFLEKIYTQEEIQYSLMYKHSPYQRFAARFAAKEAFAKAVGTGFTDGFLQNQVGVVNDKKGKPNIILFDKMHEKYGMLNIRLSLSHTDDLAIAYVIVEEIKT